MSTAEILSGLAMQAAWTLAGLLIVALAWRAGVRRFAAVGN